MVECLSFELCLSGLLTNTFSIFDLSPYITLGTTYFLKGNQQLYAVSNAKGYLIQGNLETALSWLEKAAVVGYDISSDSFFNEELKDSEEFKALLKKYPKKN